MDTRERLDKLNEAWALIEAVRDSLSSKHDTCPCCEVKRYENWEQYQARQALNSCLTRIKVVAERMVRNHECYVDATAEECPVGVCPDPVGKSVRGGETKK